MARDEQERLLTTHAGTDGVDPVTVDAEPRECVPHDRRDPCEIVDLPAPSPRVPRECPALPLRADDRERSERRQSTPEAKVVTRRDPTPVRGDHERERRIAPGAVPARDDHERSPFHAVPRAVLDRDPPDQAAVVGDQVAVVMVEFGQTNGCGAVRRGRSGPQDTQRACRSRQGEGGRDCPGEPRGGTNASQT